MLKQSIIHARIESLKSSLHAQKQYLFALKKRLLLMKENFSSKSEHERNEIDIQRFETVCKIEKTERIIVDRTEKFNYCFSNALSDIEQVDDDFERLVEDAKKNKSDEVRHLLYEANWKELDTDINKKIYFFQQLQELIHSKNAN